MTVTEARERVAKGAALMDQVRPGWAQEINPATLQMRSLCNCIIGQCYGDYERIHLVLPDGERGRTFGFDLSASDGSADPSSWMVLQDAWIEAIADRVVTGGPKDREAVQVQESETVNVAR